MTKRLTLRESHPPYTLSIEGEDVLGQEPIILERDGQPVAAIVSLAEYEAFRAWQDVRFARERLSPDEILRLAAQVYQGLSPAKPLDLAITTVAVQASGSKLRSTNTAPSLSSSQPAARARGCKREITRADLLLQIRRGWLLLFFV